MASSPGGSTATESGGGLPAGAFDRPCPALEPVDRWHLDVYGFV
jgi:hypothetical protein